MNSNFNDRDHEQRRRDERAVEQAEYAAREERDLDRNREPNPNRDPITGETGAHPIGTGAGAAVAGTIGTAVGSIAGPVGGAIGAVVGGVVGGLLGKSTAEAFDPTVEDAYWRENYSSRPYIQSGRTYYDYQPAYRTGYEAYNRYRDQGKNYDEVEPELQREYESNYRDTPVGWNDARNATRDAWDRARYNSIYQNEGQYWREHYTSEPYYETGDSYEHYEPAYRLGYEGYLKHRNTGRTYDEVEADLRRDYEREHGSPLAWEKAKHAVRKAWHRAERAFK